MTEIEIEKVIRDLINTTNLQNSDNFNCNISTDAFYLALTINFPNLSLFGQPCLISQHLVLTGPPTRED